MRNELKRIEISYKRNCSISYKRRYSEYGEFTLLSSDVGKNKYTCYISMPCSSAHLLEWSDVFLWR